MIIGICGKRQSGKDTIANMIAYIHTVGVTKANYQEWIANRVSNKDRAKRKSVHFADALKDCVFAIYNIPREYLDDEYYKDNSFFCIDNCKFYDCKDVIHHQEVYKIIDYDSLVNSPEYFSYQLENTKKLHVIKVRTILQFFGIDICRKYLGDDVWIRATMNKVDDINHLYGICIIPDVRFINEAKTIQQHPLYGGVIMVIREKNNRNDSNSIHISESIDIDCEYIITNNTTLFNLFYKVLDVYQNIIARYENNRTKR